ncbi:MAG: chromate transporter [Candidatus Eisenbacteria bacterium]|nr:chromate transporter [Candidatus Eisenbacteria bacterium]
MVELKAILEVFFVFARAGLMAWGGGPSMIPLIRAETIRHGWLTDIEFLDALAMGNALPGPIATKLSGYVGYRVAGVPGAVAATIGMAFPTVVLILLVAGVYLRFKEAPWMQSVMTGLRPAAVALLIATIVEVWPASMGGWRPVLIGGATLVALLGFHVHPALAIVGAGLFGFALGPR